VRSNFYRHFYRLILLAMAAGAALWLLGGCALLHHGKKSQSYDRAISDDDHDPTYRDDQEHAGDTVRDVQ
jgi:hypothetical protein